MSIRIILASGSDIRRQMLSNAAVPFEVEPAHIDEASVKDSLISGQARPRDVADALAEMKARKISERDLGALVIGCDQVLAFGDMILSKPRTPSEARLQLLQLAGKTHRLMSAAVICEGGTPIWRHVGIAQMQMRRVTEDYIEGYVARNWSSIRSSVGGYKLEEEGVRLFTRITGDHFHVLGLPLLEILGFLITRGVLEI